MLINFLLIALKFYTAANKNSKDNAYIEYEAVSHYVTNDDINFKISDEVFRGIIINTPMIISENFLSPMNTNKNVFEFEITDIFIFDNVEDEEKQQSSLKKIFKDNEKGYKVIDELKSGNFNNVYGKIFLISFANLSKIVNTDNENGFVFLLCGKKKNTGEVKYFVSESPIIPSKHGAEISFKCDEDIPVVNVKLTKNNISDKNVIDLASRIKLIVLFVFVVIVIIVVVVILVKKYRY